MLRNLILLSFILLTSVFFCQEGTKPLGSNLNYIYKDLHPVKLDPKTDIQQQRSSSASSAGGLNLPFFEDFYYSTTSNYPDPSKWEDSLVYVNSGMATAPPSIGVATFDGLNKHGYPYNPTLSNLTLSNRADTLTSKPINLHTVVTGTVVRTLLPSDSIVLSFFYQARGKGDNPELNDSLIVDFFKPFAHPDSAWSRVWFKQGNSSSNTNDSAFKYAYMWITDTAYFHEGFRFRFRNWASVTGNFDHWHVDYIYLYCDRKDPLADTIRDDITFGDVPTPFLKDYSEMPAKQFEKLEMAKYTHTKIRNNGSEQPTMTYKYLVYDHNHQLFGNYSGGSANLNPFRKNSYTVPPYFTHNYGYTQDTNQARPTVDTFAFDQNSSAYFQIKHFIFVDSDTSKKYSPLENDTVIQHQYFRNFYAFDDGSAEAGYYVNTIGAKMAVKIRLNKTDTLLGLRIYFDPAGNVSAISNTATTVYNFSINVWGEHINGGPNDLNNIYKDSVVNHPVYIKDGFKEVPEYKLKKPLILGPGTYFIGIQQASSILTIGFDRNYNHKTSLYYDSGSGWTQSSENGSIMMQPVFGVYRPVVGIPEFSPSKEYRPFLVYPNPSSERFTIASPKLQNSDYQLYNAVGQLVSEEKISHSEQSVSVSDLPPGIYMLILKNNGRIVQQQKIVVQH